MEFIPSLYITNWFVITMTWKIYLNNWKKSFSPIWEEWESLFNLWHYMQAKTCSVKVWCLKSCLWLRITLTAPIRFSFQTRPAINAWLGGRTVLYPDRSVWTVLREEAEVSPVHTPSLFHFFHKLWIHIEDESVLWYSWVVYRQFLAVSELTVISVTVLRWFGFI